ncbi:RNA recognition motif 2-domain-containing protein [Annulohypoxylon maeteangense]|uniref:RNA recognition motif 2-domain-containing protein n=1 Tax=Annulohypoxylon maeteangense TaxID=1927788 RepID=UPI00200826AD|nr:RNA recognition motif 2-domain-containing protein [Annulohypoxylon maeteangense]KAI0883439.1 RNA recognition motif 2-domain-containing protein [Annulohypoxylon maeteangense]
MSMHQQTREGHYNPASPHSSSGAADSFKGTPDTRLTAFSPEDGSARSTRVLGTLNHGSLETAPPAIKYGMNALQSFGQPSMFNLGTCHTDKDPFVSSAESSFKGSQKLSPTASVFSPLPSAFIPRGSASEPKRADAFSEDLNQGYSQISGQLPRPASVPASSDFVHDKLSTESGISRCLVISARMGGNVAAGEVNHYISGLRQMGTPFQGKNEIFECGSQVFARFSNIRDACTVFSNISLGGRDWDVRSVNPREFSSVVEPGAGLVTAHEGQVYLSVFSHSMQPITVQQLEEFLKAALRTEGDLYAFKPHDGVTGSAMSGIAEYCDNEMSLRAVAKLNGVVVQGFQICIVLYRPDVTPNATQSGVVGSTSSLNTSSDLTSGFRRMSIGRSQSVMTTPANSLLTTPARPTIPANSFSVPQSYGMVPLMYSPLSMSPSYVLDQGTPRTYGSVLQPSNYSLVSPAMSQHNSLASTDLMTPRQFQNIGRLDGRRQNAMRISRSPYYNSANHANHVDINRIREGTDVRTTIMLRNIPNKVHQAMLKDIVDQSSRGKYDFMYLRIDFANDCNVGYAFINFVDPLDVIDFVQARGNQKWNCFRSDKIAEISYATIQGKDCLVQKFRNSSVMLEAPHYRPKLFFTINGPYPELAGNEEPFPEPDNQSKMKRSCENAEHVGLFTPNAGQHFRDEQRRRRSQFDRGNPRLQEYEYNPPAYNQGYYPQ